MQHFQSIKRPHETLVDQPTSPLMIGNRWILVVFSRTRLFVRFPPRMNARACGTETSHASHFVIVQRSGLELVLPLERKRYRFESALRTATWFIWGLFCDRLAALRCFHGIIQSCPCLARTFWTGYRRPWKSVDSSNDSGHWRVGTGSAGRQLLTGSRRMIELATAPLLHLKKIGSFLALWFLIES